MQYKRKSEVPTPWKTKFFFREYYHFRRNKIYTFLKFWFLYFFFAWIVYLLILFVVLGGLLVLKWRWIGFVHVPAVVWGALIEFQNWLCPLTTLENRLRKAGGAAGYPGGFVEHYVIPVVYPPGLTRNVQIALGLAVLAVNICVYGWLVASRLRARRERKSDS